MVTKVRSRSYVYQYRAGNRSRSMTFPFKLGLDKARREARKAVGGVAGGGTRCRNGGRRGPGRKHAAINLSGIHPP